MNFLDLYDELTRRLRAVGEYVWPLALRLILFWEFWEAGLTKLRGENWFADIPWADWQKGFPWPFNILSPDLNWLLATWAELAFSIALLFGLFTRFTAVSLLVITMVATAAVHWPAEWDGLPGLWEGYVITSNGSGNFKLPLIFLVMLLPLIFHGGGRFSLDRWLLAVRSVPHPAGARPDAVSAALALGVLALAAVWVEPLWGAALGVMAMAAASLQLRTHR